MYEQLSMFEQVTVNDVLNELETLLEISNVDHKIKNHYIVEHFKGQIQINLYRETCDSTSKERIIDRGLLLKKNSKGNYNIMFFNKECLSGIIDIRFDNKLLKWFFNQTEILEV